MSKHLTAILSIAILIALTGCGGSNNTDSTPSTSDSGSAISKLVGGNDYVSDEDLNKLKEACDILSMDIVKEYAVGVAESDIEKMEVYGCQYSWDKQNKEEIEAQNNQILTEGLSQGLSFMEISEKQLSSENSISLSIDTFLAYNNEEALDLQFRSRTNMQTEEEKAAANKALQDAINQSDDLSDDQKDLGGGLLGTIQSEAEKNVFTEVEGVGVRAAWSDRSKELVVQHRNIFFKVTVDLDNENQNLESAKELAKTIIKKIDQKV